MQGTGVSRVGAAHRGVMRTALRITRRERVGVVRTEWECANPGARSDGVVRNRGAHYLAGAPFGAHRSVGECVASCATHRATRLRVPVRRRLRCGGAPVRARRCAVAPCSARGGGRRDRPGRGGCPRRACRDGAIGWPVSRASLARPCGTPALHLSGTPAAWTQGPPQLPLREEFVDVPAVGACVAPAVPTSVPDPGPERVSAGQWRFR
jgi:hypothetical protein